MMQKGNCLKAAWDLALDKISHKDEHVIVHAMREIYGGEVWGGHAFVLNKTTNHVLSKANNDMQENGGKPLDVSFEEAKEMVDNFIQKDIDLYVYSKDNRVLYTKKGVVGGELWVYWICSNTKLRY